MPPIVAVIAPGMMGSGVGARLAQNGVEVRTSLAGRSEASVARAKAAGMIGVPDDQIAASDIILSIVPPGEALGLAERLAPALRAAPRKPIYVDCNAVHPGTVLRIARVMQEPVPPSSMAASSVARRNAGQQGAPDLPLRRSGARGGGAEAVRAGDAGAAWPDRRGLGDEDVLRRHHQGVHRAGRSHDACRHARRHRRGAEAELSPASRRCSAGSPGRSRGCTPRRIAGSPKWRRSPNSSAKTRPRASSTKARPSFTNASPPTTRATARKSPRSRRSARTKS